MEENNFEIHDPAALAQARAILTSSELPRDWARAVVEAVSRNDEWRGKRCINLLAPEAPTSPTVPRCCHPRSGHAPPKGILGGSTAGLQGRSILTKSRLCAWNC